MILTVTLNPAIDKTMTAHELNPGQVNRMTGIREYAGGKGINVTKMLRQMDIPVTGMGFIGGFTGQFILNAMKDRGVLCQYTQVEGTTRTSLNILSEDGYVTEILEPGTAVSDTERENFMAAFRKNIRDCSTAVFSGSLPDGIPSDFYAGLIRIAKEFIAKHPDIKAIMLECTGMQPFARAIQREVDLPVFSWGTLLDYAWSCVAHRDYYGHI